MTSIGNDDNGNDPTVSGLIGSVHEAASEEAGKAPSEGGALARVGKGGALAPRQLEERRLIHRESSVRRHTDAFRKIRTRLLEMADHRNFVTLIAAVSERSGASFVARNLATAFAFDETKSSLLIDCNMRYPTQHKALDVDFDGSGLIDFLDHPDLDIQSTIHPTGIPNLQLIPAGTERENSSEYFSSPRMRAALDTLRNSSPNRYLFLDGPSIKGSPDARILSDLADFVIVVAGYARDTPEAITQAVANFNPNKVAGVVFDNLP